MSERPVQIQEAERQMECPECGRVSSVAPWLTRPICVHSWASGVPEIWDGDDVNGEGRPIECSPNENYRVPGPDTWAVMVPVEVVPRSVAETFAAALEDALVGELTRARAGRPRRLSGFLPARGDAVSETITGDLLAHARYLLQGDDYAKPDECETCRKLKAAGALYEAYPRRNPVRWKVRPDAA